MKVVKATLGRLALFCLLIAGNTLLCVNVVPDVFPVRNLSSIYLLFLSALLIRYYSYRVTGSGHLSIMIKSLSWMAFLLILLRGIKYSVFAGVGVLARHSWYLYYLPVLLLPLFFFCIALMITPGGGMRIPGKWYPAAAVTAVLILLVMTNDLHGLVFSFRPGFEDWATEYSRGWLFYAVTAWQYALYICGVLILVFKCKTASGKTSAWLIALPFALGIAMNVLLMTGKMPTVNGTNIVEYPEAQIFMVAGVLECCMQSGLIPTNKSYGKLFGILSVSAQITDRGGNPVYLSRSAVPLTPEQFLLPDGARTGEHTVQHKMELPGGFGFWHDDMTELDRLNDELAEAKEALAQEAALTRMQNELREKRAKIEQRSAMYDMIARRTRAQSARISLLAKEARSCADTAQRELCCARITLLASFIKRFANLILLSCESRTVGTGEFGLSFSEVLRYLNRSGIPGEVFCDAGGDLPAEAAVAVFEAFGNLIEANLECLRGVFVNLSPDGGAACKLTLENLRTGFDDRDTVRAGVRAEAVVEDGVTYIGFFFPKGGMNG